jgi:hypothetical protein
MGGIMVPIVSGLGSGGADDEDTDDNKWTYFQSSWSKHSKSSIFEGDKGMFAYIDHNSVVPNTTVMEVFESALQGNFKRAGDALSKEVIGPFLAYDVFTQSMVEALLNQKNLGTERKIYQEHDETLTKIAAGMLHVGDRIKPGVLTTGQRMIKAIGNYSGNPSYEDFKNYQIGIEVMTSVTGLRTSPGDVATSYRINLGKSASMLNSELNEYRDKARIIAREFPNMSRSEREQKLAQSKERAERLATKTVNELILMHQAATKTSAEYHVILDYLKKSSLPKEVKSGILRGVVELPPIDNI